MVRTTRTLVRDVVVIGSGFGGSPAALRLTEAGYDVLVLERGRRWTDDDFPESNWNIRKYLWVPGLRCFGLLHLDPFRDVLALHGSGVGGGSLIYGNVLVEPSDAIKKDPEWSRLQDWRTVLSPHYETAKRMLGVTPNPKLWPADIAMQDIARWFGGEKSFRPAPVGVYFGESGQAVPDPFFDGVGPWRTGCTHCGGCMVGCRVGAKNTLVKNYLYLAEKKGAEIRPETEVCDIRPLPDGQPDGARYEIVHRSSTSWIRKKRTLRARSVVLSASTLGTLRLLFRCRDVHGSLPNISRQLGKMVRTNSEALLGSTSRDLSTDYSRGIAITSLFQPDEVTTIQPVRFPKGSSSMRLLSGPVIPAEGSVFRRLGRIAKEVFRHPIDFGRMLLFPKWAERSTIILAMQIVEKGLHLSLGRSILTLWRRDLVSMPADGERTSGRIDIAHRVMRMFNLKTDGVAAESWNESLADVATTAHILGGVPFGTSQKDGVIDLDFQVHGYPGLHVVDGSVMPANPGVNPSLTITALSELFAERFVQKQKRSA